MKMQNVLFATVVIGVAATAFSGEGPVGSVFEQARKLEQEGKAEEAFLKYLSVPGGEYAAMSLARRKPEEFLKTLRTRADGVPVPRFKLIEGDLLLALGRKDDAMACYRQVVAKIARKPSDGWDDGFMPRDYYPVEPPANVGRNRPLQPFSMGPGSHRDNWLIRRLIALEAWDEAAAEFARIWEIHRIAAKPHIAVLPFYDQKTQKVKQQKRLIRPAGFDGFGLQFAIDYAYFLKRRKQMDKSLAVLMEPLLAVDMDKNPNPIDDFALIDLRPSAQSRQLPEGAEEKYPVLTGRVRLGRRYLYREFSSGIARKEFIRLAYGAFKSAGKEKELVDALLQQIAKGKNSARRVLAQVRFHQGKDDEALALEQEYIDKGGFDKSSVAYRRGLAYEGCRKNAEAVAEYERVLSLPSDSFNLPDPDEEAVETWRISSVIFRGGGGSKTEVLQRLNRLYGALGQTDKVVDNALRQLQANPRLLENLSSLEQTARKLRMVGKEKQFLAWARKQIPATESHTARANLYWCLDDYKQCARELGPVCKNSKDRWYGFEGWSERFRKVGKDELRTFLIAVLEADHKNARARLELLDLEDRFEGDEAIELLEGLLDSDASFAFARAKGTRNRTRFRDYYDLAYRLMRLYEKQGRDEKIVRLGMRILKGKKPFTRSDQSPLLTPRANWHSRSQRQDLLDCLYVMLAHATKPADIEKIAAMVDASDCIPLKNQLAKLLPKRRNTRIDPSEIHRRKYDRVVVKTLGSPDGVRLLTNRDDVRAVSADGRWIGTSWGLVRYKAVGDKTLEILQIPIGVRVMAFCDTPAGLFVGTRDGLYRLDGPDKENPSLVRVDLESVKRKRGDTSEYAIYTNELLWWQDALWVHHGDGLFRYDPVKKTARYFGRVPGRLFAASDTLWTERHVLNRVTDEFELIRGEYRQWRLIGATSKEIWADVNVNNELRHRPALVDPKTHTLRALLIENAPADGKEICVNGSFAVLAEDKDRVWLLGDDSHLTVYDRATGKLRQVTRHYEGSARPDAKDRGPAVWRAYNAAGQFYRFYCGSGTRENIPGLNLDGDRGPYFCWRELPGDRLLLGAGIMREWQEDNLGFDDNDGMSHHVQDLEGGLFEIDTKTLRWQKLGSRAKELTDFYVKRISFDDRRRKAYVCTNGGVTILSLPGCEIAGRITVSDGLPSNKVEDCVRIGEKLYMACELGDEDGGLAVKDLKTGLSQRLSMADGLKSDKIKRLRADGTDLHILYGTIYGVRANNTPQDDSVQAEGADDRVRTFTSSILDTKTGKLRSGSEVLPAARPPDDKKRLPYLGGAVLCDVTHAGKRLIGGTHGLVIVRPGVDVEDRVRLPVEPVKPVLSLQQKQLAEAAKVPVPRSISLKELKTFLKHKNPYVKANALAAAMRPVQEGNAEYTPVVGKCVADPCDRVRATAVWLLSRAKDDAAIEPLRVALGDRDPYIRAVAALGLARRGALPPLSHFEGMLKQRDQYGNYPYGASSSVGVEVGKERIYSALAPHADRAVFELMMKYALVTDDYEPREKIGASLREHPDAAEVLLRAYDHDRYSCGQVRFAQAVFGHAGKSMLPILYKALTSKDRVVRSNAARACGAIGDPAAIQRLIKALDLESGYSRASIVWALGELKAEKALPQLGKLYVDARNDEHRRRGSGFRASQSQAAIRAHYDTFSNLDALGGEWNELKQAARPKPVDPRRNEELLSPKGILAAVGKIGPAASQPFYRSIAGEKDIYARFHAAQWLADCGRDDVEENSKILRNLLADDDERIRMIAAVSLLILGKEISRQPILQWLDSPNEWQKRAILGPLARVKDADKLSFARSRIKAIATDDRLDRYTREAAQTIVQNLFQK